MPCGHSQATYCPPTCDSFSSCCVCARLSSKLAPMRGCLWQHGSTQQHVWRSAKCRKNADSTRAQLVKSLQALLTVVWPCVTEDVLELVRPEHAMWTHARIPCTAMLPCNCTQYPNRFLQRSSQHGSQCMCGSTGSHLGWPSLMLGSSYSPPV